MKLFKRPEILRHVPERLESLLERLRLIILECGAPKLIGALPTSFMMVGALIVFFSSLQLWGAHRDRAENAIVIGALVLVIGIAGAAIIEFTSRKFDLVRIFNRKGCLFLVAGLMAHLSVFCFLIVLFVAVWPTQYSSGADFSYAFWTNGYHDKRWVYLTYVFSISVVLVVPAILIRLLRGPEIEDMQLSETRSLGAEARWSSWKKISRSKNALIALKLLVAILIAWYYWGPPWHLSSLQRTFDGHESVPVAASLAMLQGKIPYAEAISQYGPGAQLVLHWYTVANGFDVVALRESYAFVGLLSALLFCFVCLLTQRFWVALLAIYFSLCYSSFGSQAFRLAPDGQLSFGQFAWNVPLRYIGAIFLGVVISRCLLALSNRNRWAGSLVVLVGIVWGISIYTAQENFAAGVITILLVGLVGWLTRTIDFRVLSSFAGWFFLGVFLAIMPVFAYYYSVGHLRRLFSLYFHLSGLVPLGFSNTPWDPAYNGLSLTIAYYTTTPLFLILGVGALYFKTSAGLVTRLSPRRFEFVGILASAIALFIGALFRSDGSHMTGFASAVPLLAAVAIERWAGFLSISRGSTRFVQAVVVLAMFFAYPFATSISRVSEVLIGGGVARFFAKETAGPAVIARIGADRPVVVQRFGYEPALQEPCAPFSTVACGKLIEELTELRRLTGRRPVIIHELPILHDSAAYFLADLIVGTRFTARNNSVITKDDFRQWLEEIRSPATGCLITSSLESEEAAIFKQTHDQIKVDSRLLDREYFVMCRPPRQHELDRK